MLFSKGRIIAFCALFLPTLLRGLEVVSSFSLLLAVTKAHTHLTTRFSIYILRLLNFVRNKINLRTSLHLFRPGTYKETAERDYAFFSGPLTSDQVAYQMTRQVIKLHINSQPIVYWQVLSRISSLGHQPIIHLSKPTISCPSFMAMTFSPETKDISAAPPAYKVHVIWTPAEVVSHFWCTKAREGLMQIRLPLSGIVECLAEPSRFNLDDKITLVLCTK